MIWFRLWNQIQEKAQLDKLDAPVSKKKKEQKKEQIEFGRENVEVTDLLEKYSELLLAKLSSKLEDKKK